MFFVLHSEHIKALIAKMIGSGKQVYEKIRVPGFGFCSLLFHLLSVLKCIELIT